MAENTVAKGAVARPVNAGAVVDQLRALDLDYVITVPDTHQRTVLSLLAGQARPRLLTACTEDEALAIHTGLYAGGKESLLVIQHSGFFASANVLRCLPIEIGIPTVLMVGLYHRDVDVPAREDRRWGIRMVEPTLETWGVPYLRLDGPEDVDVIGEAYQLANERRGPVVVLVGAATA